ncbi:biotin/lipoyl-binding protein [Hymenobacter canadensis]|uniref:Efflux RND transporter periplasmic adaptor subunit n=1 Tax=Hymenobacter canadensis TaxID=2999067 RepID=A0ABY7LKR6_9BACT|nr:biotin/lipoyl-binding protein [Hymenobacter canadensis]WBA41030.1 efflux RND transporter periplasmic adaptor subunit [Hymenobacter canadensis]
MNKFVGMASVILLGALGVLALWLSRLPDAPTPDSSTLTAYLSTPQPAAQPTVPAGVAVPATVAGRVWEVYFTEGQHVRKGQLLLKVAQKLVSAEHHRLQQQLTRQQLRQTTLTGQQPAAPATELAAAAALVAATGQQLAALPSQLSFQFVTAPHDGVMVRRSVASGDYLSLGDAIGQLAPLPATPADDTTLLLSSAN